ncbi:MAG: DUF3108 domain-containing protein [Burkholderiales bacterium]
MSELRATYRRDWVLALAASVALHAFALFGVPELRLAPPLPPPTASLIARIVEAPATKPAAAPTPAPHVTPKPRSIARPAPKPVSPAPVSLPDPNPLPPHPMAPETEIAEAVPALIEGGSIGSAAAPTEAPADVLAASDPTVNPIEKQVPTPVLSPSPSKYPLKAATIIYDLSYGANPMRVGRVTHSWSNDGERYFAETVIEATGVFALLYGGQYVQRSWGVFGPHGLIPTEFFVQRGRPDRAESAQFDWDENRVDFAWRGERRSAKLVSGTQDPISMLHQIYFMQPLPDGKVFSVASSRKIATYEYLFLGEEDIQTPLGAMRAIRVQRKDDDADHVDVWVDPARSFLPVRVHYVDRKGTVFDQRVREIRTEAASVEAPSSQPDAPIPVAPTSDLR